MSTRLATLKLAMSNKLNKLTQVKQVKYNAYIIKVKQDRIHVLN